MLIRTCRTRGRELGAARTRHLLLLALAAAVVAVLAFAGVPRLVMVKAEEAICAVAAGDCRTEGRPAAGRAPQESPAPPPRAGGGVPGAARTPGAGQEKSRRPAPPDTDQARTRLAALRETAERESGSYERERFPHWSDKGDGCTTRELVLKRDGDGVRTGSDCDLTGRWTSPYDGRTWTRTGDVDIDHMVPLKEAWESGASEWSTDERERFANDLRRPQLWSVTDNVNQEKSDRDPAEWRPPREQVWCEYARAWIEVKYAWKLTADQAEKKSLSTMLGRC